MTELTNSQKRLLTEWYRWHRGRHNEGIMPEGTRQQTLEALERQGLLRDITRDGWGGATQMNWRATITDDGIEAARQLVEGPH